jgi:hypothetical protein
VRRLAFSFGATLLLCGIGGAVTYWGWSEWQVGTKSSAEPVSVDLARLEAGERPPDNHIKLGPHHACYYSTVYSYKKRKGDPENPPPGSTLTYAFYPVLSPSNPDIKALEPLLQQYGDLDKIPKDVNIPFPKHCIVLVKSNRFATVGDLPREAIRREDAVQGLVINEISRLSADEENLIRKTFPAITTGSVFILEENRRPYSVGLAITIYVLGLAIIGVTVLGAIGVFVWSLLRRAAPPTRSPLAE